ncbi:TIGR02757 family protein [soil metagenome]
MDDLKEYLNKIYIKYKKKHSSKDPVWKLHEYSDRKDIEILGLIISCFCYGRVDQINLFIDQFLDQTSENVYEFTLNFDYVKDKKRIEKLYYRFNDHYDLASLLNNIKAAIISHGSLEKTFLKYYDKNDANVINGLEGFTRELRKSKHKNSKAYAYLIPNVLKSSTCKRLNLYLRWMVRQDEIDTGVWSKNISPSKLIIPVDTHVYKIARQLNLIQRKSCDLKFAIELTEKLKEFDPKDPVKYDFALCHIGIDKEG